jgi:DNA primase
MSGFEPVAIEDLLRELGIAAERRGTKWHARCPAPDHDDKHPSWFIRDDPGEKWHGSHSCRSCGLSGGPWELVASVRKLGIDEAAAFVRALLSGRTPTQEGVPEIVVKIRRRRKVYELPPGVVVPATIEDWYQPALRYLLERGVTAEQILRWGIGYAKRGPLAWRVVVPVHTRGKLVAFAARAIFDDGSKRYDMPTRNESGARPDVAVWGEPGFDRSRGAITVAEGVFSALALERIGAPNPCALLGSETTAQKVSVLEQWPVVLVATDPDAAGEKAARKLAALLGRRCWVERVELEASPDDCDPKRLRRAVNIATGGFAHVRVA